MRKLKKVYAFLLTVCIGVTTGLPCYNSVNVSAATVSVNAGDLNKDGSINVIDYVLLKKLILNGGTSADLTLADVNSDGKLDVMDVAFLKKILMRMILPENPQSSSKILFIGRSDTSDTAGPKFAWSTSTIKANFQGTGISVNLKSTGDNWFNVIVDGVVKTPINVSSSTSSYIILASGLTQGKHTIELVKRTEASVGEVQFLGFNVTDGSLLDPPAPSSKRIIFIGDSITCGYGNEGTSQYQSFTTKNENAYLAYGAVASRLLGADPMTISWSGKGIMRNYGGNTTDLMPALYQRILPYNTTLLWDDSKWIPQVVVINLCTNDFSTGIMDKTTFTTAYSGFVDRIRNQYSNADIYCAVGPMLNGDSLVSARDYINTTVNLKKSSGDPKVHFIEFPVQDSINGYGEDWHPSVKTHELMAKQLAEQIQKDLGW